MIGVKIQDKIEKPGGGRFLNVYLKDILPLLGERVFALALLEFGMYKDD